MSKHGNVVLTRMYPHFKPAPADDGVKAYALCPFYIPTRMVLEEPNFGNKEGMGKEEATRNATKEIYKRTKDRMLTMEEVHKISKKYQPDTMTRWRMAGQAILQTGGLYCLSFTS